MAVHTTREYDLITFDEVTPSRDETLPQLAQAIQHLPLQAYPQPPSNLQDTLARDNFIDALPESEVRWSIHQARPKSLQDALTTALEIEGFYVADRHPASIQARAVFPSSHEAPTPMPPPGLGATYNSKSENYDKL